MPTIHRAQSGLAFKRALADRGMDPNDFADLITEGKPNDSMRRNASRWAEDGPPILAKRLLDYIPKKKG